MKTTRRTLRSFRPTVGFGSLGAFVLALALAVPCSAGIHYKASTRVHDATGKASETQVEGWVSGDKAKVEFLSTSGAAMPFAARGNYLLTSNGGKDLYLVDPDEKTYAKWSLDGMMKLVGGMMNGLGPLLKIELGDPKVEKVLDEDGGEVLGTATRHLQYRTRYTMKVRVIGISSSSDVDSVEDFWLASKWTDIGLGVWLRADPPRTGNVEFDKLIDASRGRASGFPLKTTIVSTTTQSKGKRQSVTRSTTEVTELKSVSVPDSTFALPSGYSEVAAPVGPGEGEEGAGGLGSLFQKRKPDGGR